MRKNKSRVWRGVGVALVGSMLAAWTPAAQPEKPVDQPEGAAEHRRPAGQSKAGAMPRDAFKARLERRLAEAKETQSSVEKALKMLESGASVDDVRKLTPDGGRGMHDDGERGPDGMRGGPMWDRDSKQRSDRPNIEFDPEVTKEILRHASPEMAAKIDELAKKDPDAAKEKLKEMFPRMRPLLEMRARDPEMYRVRLEDLALARQAIPLAKKVLKLQADGAAADSKEMRETQESLRAILLKQFENRAKMDALEIEAMARRLEEKKKRLEEMKKSPERTIDRILQGLMNRAGKQTEEGSGDGLGALGRPEGGRPPEGKRPPD